MRTYHLTIEPQWVGTKDPKRFTLPMSLNARAHWAERRRVDQAFKEATFWACKEAKAKPLGRARIELTHFAVRPRDRDNRYASVKAIIDAIVDAKVIPDDSDEYLDLECLSVKVPHKDEERVEITIEEIV